MQPASTTYGNCRQEVSFVASKPNSVRSILCVLTSDFGSRHQNTHVGFYPQDVISDNLDISATGGKTWKPSSGISKLGRITELNMFNSRVYEFKFMRNITLK
jgi:hypothetical protein